MQAVRSIAVTVLSLLASVAAASPAQPLSVQRGHHLPNQIATSIQDPTPQVSERPILRHVIIDGASVYSRDDVLWLLDLREGSPLARSSDAIAKALQERYERDGYTEARVQATEQQGTLTLRVNEGRIDEIELRGVEGAETDRLKRLLDIREGDIYNKRTVGQAVYRIVRDSGGALTTGDVSLEHRGDRNVLVVPVRWHHSQVSFSTSDGREDVFSPVDGLNPSIGFTTVVFDRAHFNHTLVSGFVSYKFAREDTGYSLGLERPLFRGPRLFVGAELHDLTTSDDLWRLSSGEQSLVSLAFKNSFRDYYRRRGAQLFTTLQAGAHNELFAMVRWDRHEPLTNATNYSFFRDDAVFRSNVGTVRETVNAAVFGYTFDTRPLTGSGEVATYQRHLKDSLFGFGVRQAPGLRIEWTSEMAGHNLGGDAQFDRHILDLRGYVAMGPHQLWSSRALFGVSRGALSAERLFTLGGIGTVHGYSFKEATGSGMALLNTQYRVDLTRAHDFASAFGVFGFYDAGRVTDPVPGSRSDWLQGTGFGFGTENIRLEFGFRVHDFPGSRQILVRLSPTF